MAILIDGYNLLHAAGIVGAGRGPRGLERSRLALLNFLAESLDPADQRQVTVVFDAAGGPPGLPAESGYRGLAVRFAKGYADADELLEELIRAESAPRQLTVVSSDHRVQRAARRRGATAVDSDRWYEETLRRRGRRRAEPAAKPQPPLSDLEVAWWLKQFADEPAGEEAVPDKPAAGDDAIFPPGYAEGVWEEEGGGSDK